MLRHDLSPAAVALLGADAKVGVLATVDPAGRPHVTLITSLSAKGPQKLMFGQFSEGLSKTHVRVQPKVGFLALDGERCWLRGKAVWRSAVRQGEDFEMYNRKPMFRYNAYFGIHTVHYLDVVEAEEGGELKVPSLVAGAALARATRITAVARCTTPALTPWAAKLVSRASTLKFASYVGDDGHPVLIPGVGACTAGAGRLVVACPAGDEAAARLPDSVVVSVFALDRELHSVLVRGQLARRCRAARALLSTLDIDWVYNSMPPKHGQIFPRMELRSAALA